MIRTERRHRLKRFRVEGDNIVLHMACVGCKVLCHNFNPTPKLNRTRSTVHTQKKYTKHNTIQYIYCKHGWQNGERVRTTLKEKRGKKKKKKKNQTYPKASEG